MSNVHFIYKSENSRLKIWVDSVGTFIVERQKRNIMNGKRGSWTKRYHPTRIQKRFLPAFLSAIKELTEADHD